MAKSEEDGWLTGRDRHVRVYLTEDEHALVRSAAAKADQSVSRFSIEAIVEAARQKIGERTETPAEPVPEPVPVPKRKPGRPRKNPLPVATEPQPVKRKPGRPRKTPAPEATPAPQRGTWKYGSPRKDG
jgi:hypothetical protein